MPREVRTAQPDEELDWDSEKYGSMADYADDGEVPVEEEEEN